MNHTIRGGETKCLHNKTFAQGNGIDNYCHDDYNNNFVNPELDILKNKDLHGGSNSGKVLRTLDPILSFDIVDTVQAGGFRRTISTGYFKSGYKTYLIADVTDQRLRSGYFSRLHRLGISKQTMENIKPHITLMEIIVNRANPDSKYIIDGYGQMVPVLKALLDTKYNQLKNNMRITSSKGRYSVMGDFMAKVYRASDNTHITSFRMVLYSYLSIMLGRFRRKKITYDGKGYYVYLYNNKELIAVPDYYHGKGNWTPHMSLIRLDKVQKDNLILYNAYKRQGLSVLVNALHGSSGSIDNLNLATHFGVLRTSVIRT